MHVPCPSRRTISALVVLFALLSLLATAQTSPNVPASQHSTTDNAKSKATCTNNGTYTNSKGETVRRPENCSAAPKGATAQCRDGSYSFSQIRRGTCSHHGGVAKWL